MNENETTLQRFSKLFNVHYPSKSMITIPANRVAKECNVTLLVYKTKDGQWYVNDSRAIKDSDTLMFIICPVTGEFMINPGR
jgi:hypothetical protein